MLKQLWFLEGNDLGKNYSVTSCNKVRLREYLSPKERDGAIGELGGSIIINGRGFSNMHSCTGTWNMRRRPVGTKTGQGSTSPFPLCRDMPTVVSVTVWSSQSALESHL